MQKGISEEGLEFLTEKAVAEDSATATFINGTSKSYAIKQAEMKSQVKKFSEQIRKNSTIAQDDTTPSLLGFDVILNSALALPDVFLAKGTPEPWLMDRGLLLKHLQKLQTLGCKKQQIRIDNFLLLRSSEATD